MAKARMTMIIQKEYEIVPEMYKGASTDEERLNIDMESLRQAPYKLLESGEVNVSIEGELITDEKDENQLSLSIENNRLNIPVVGD